MAHAVVRNLRKTRSIFVVLAVVAASIVTWNVLAHADAPDPVLASTTGTVHDNGNGTKTLSVQGNWQWTTHHSDCNNDQRAVGFAVDWGDGNGNVVVAPVAVGVKNATSLNAADNKVHPTPATEIANPSFGGCGFYSAADGFNSGTWGPLTHKYASDATIPKVCVVMYDVHLNTDGGTPKAASETVAGGSGHNGDNSLEKNSSTPLGNGCFTKTFPTLTTTASSPPGDEVPATVGGTIHDVAHLTGGNNATGTMSFTVYGPNDTNCTGAGTAVAGGAVNGDGDYPSADFPVSQAGTYRWIAHYSGDANNAAMDTGCNDANESSVVSKIRGSLTTQATQSVALGKTIQDVATLSGTSNATGTITFAVYGPTNPNCTGSGKAMGTRTVNGNGSYNSNVFKPTVAGTYKWIAHYSGDATNAALTTSCDDPAEASVVNGPGVTSKQRLLPNDTGFVTNFPNAGGTMTFKLFDANDSTCSNPPIYTEDVQVVNGVADTNNTLVIADKNGTYRWKIKYTGDPVSGAPAYTTPCGTERFTIVNG
jgi:hypothetical protein